MSHWILKDREPVEVDLMTWAEWFGTADRSVAQTAGRGYRVSTVFLGLDHRFGGGGPPLLFETMVFADRSDSVGADVDQRRYSTWDEAAAGHEEMVEEWREKTAEGRK